MRGGMGTEGVAAVVGNVEPLVAVGRPGVGRRDPGDEVAGPRVGGRPQTEDPVHVHPGAGIVGGGGGRRQVVEGAGVHVARQEADDGRPSAPLAEHPPQIGHVDGSLTVGGHRLQGAGAQAQLKAIRSQPVVSTSAAVAASRAPPVTNPK